MVQTNCDEPRSPGARGRTASEGADLGFTSCHFLPRQADPPTPLPRPHRPSPYLFPSPQIRRHPLENSRSSLCPSAARDFLPELCVLSVCLSDCLSPPHE